MASVSTQAPRVPPSINSMAARYIARRDARSFLSGAEWLQSWRELGGEAVATIQADGGLAMFIRPPAITRPFPDPSAIALLTVMNDDAVNADILAELMAEGAVR